MDISPEFEKILVDELTYSLKMMRNSKTPDEKLFYFSGLFGVLPRIFNIEFDPQIVFMHIIITSAYNAISERLNAIKGGNIVIEFPEGFFDKLADASEDLIEKIKNNEDIYKALEKISILTFLTTGNGYYLFQKGSFKI
jgi:hypothetical protein